MIRILNTLTGEKEDFSPINDPVQVYVCGVTPYSQSHVGHALSAIQFDVIRRYLEFRGYSVRYVVNFTDIDDKIIARSLAAGLDARELVEQQIADYFRDFDALGVRRADVYPRATGEIPYMIDAIQTLIDKGYAYPSDGDVYYRVRKFEGYGKLSHRSVDSLLSGARIEVDEQKEDPLDFALWKAAKPGEPKWDSPWGEGRPGWHIECSVMSLRHLGEQIDIHGGGADLIFPHHENEIAQSEAMTGKAPFAKYWLHNGLLNLADQKMSKSIGNLVTIREALEKHSPDAMRLFILSSNYRSPLTYSSEGVEASERGAERIRAALALPEQGSGDAFDSQPWIDRFTQSMDDDFNAAGGVAVVFDLVREINRRKDEGKAIGDAQKLVRRLAGDILGLQFTSPATTSSDGAGPFIELVVEIRKDLRQAKQFDLADRVRKRLEDLGIVLEDGPGGTSWKAKS